MKVETCAVCLKEIKTNQVRIYLPKLDKWGHKKCCAFKLAELAQELVYARQKVDRLNEELHTIREKDKEVIEEGTHS